MKMDWGVNSVMQRNVLKLADMSQIAAAAAEKTRIL